MCSLFKRRIRKIVYNYKNYNMNCDIECYNYLDCGLFMFHYKFRHCPFDPKIIKKNDFAFEINN